MSSGSLQYAVGCRICQVDGWIEAYRQFLRTSVCLGGFDQWQASASLIFGFLAKEVVIGHGDYVCGRRGFWVMFWQLSLAGLRLSLYHSWCSACSMYRAWRRWAPSAVKPSRGNGQYSLRCIPLPSPGSCRYWSSRSAACLFRKNLKGGAVYRSSLRRMNTCFIKY